MILLRDHAHEAFRLDNGVPETKEALIGLARMNLQYHTALHTEASRQHLQAISDTVDIQKLADGLEDNPYINELTQMIDRVPVTRPAKMATVALIAANAGILRECQAGFPTPGVSNLFADNESWDQVLKAVAITAHKKRSLGEAEEAPKPTEPPMVSNTAHYANNLSQILPGDLSPKRTLN